jgi:hypothetical protein
MIRESMSTIRLIGGGIGVEQGFMGEWKKATPPERKRR